MVRPGDRKFKHPVPSNNRPNISETLGQNRALIELKNPNTIGYIFEDLTFSRLIR